MPNSITSAIANLSKLTAFRQAVYGSLGPARDALFELSDTVLLTPQVRSFTEYSQSSVFRRQWPSVYEAIQDGRPDRAALLKVCLHHVPQTTWRLAFMGDHTAWPRPQAYTLCDRTVEHQPTPIPGARPITMGQGYATLAWIPEARGRLALPLLHERIPNTGHPLETAVAQLRAVCAELPNRIAALFDAEYGCAPFVQQTANIARDKLVRLHSNLCLCGPPPPYRGFGRPSVHGRKFKLRDARTWGKPTTTLEADDPELGLVRVQVWGRLHFKKAAQHPVWVIHLERLNARNVAALRQTPLIRM